MLTIPNATITVTNVTCNGDDDGTISVTNPTGGSGGTYQVKINTTNSSSDGTYVNLTGTQQYTNLDLTFTMYSSKTVMDVKNLIVG